MDALSVQVVVVDDLSNAVEESLNRVRELTKCDDDQLIFRKVRLGVRHRRGECGVVLGMSCPVLAFLVVSSCFADQAGAVLYAR